MKQYSNFIGIDVAKAKLDVSVVKTTDPNRPEHFIVSNDVKGIRTLFKKLNKQQINDSELLVCFEDTGVYSMPLCLNLSKMKVDYWMVPAIEIKRSKGLSRGKNDKSDARDIAFYALTHQHKLRLSHLPAQVIMKLKALFTEREKLLKAVKLLQSTEESKGFYPKSMLADVLKLNASALKKLNSLVDKVEQKMKEVLARNEALNSQSELIQSIPGIGPQTAIYLLVATRGFSCFDNWRQLACYAGVAPFEYSSGSSIKGRTKVSPLADKKLKSLLNMCALNAKKYDLQIKQYYERKIKEGKPKMLVLNNIRCKLLGRVFAVINRGTPYVNTQKFAA